MKLRRIFSLLNALNLGDKNEYLHDAAKSRRTDANDILKCNMINDTNSIGIKLIKRNKDLIMRFDYKKTIC